MCETFANPKNFEDWTADDFLKVYDNGYEFNEYEIKQLARGDFEFGEMIEQVDDYIFNEGKYMMTVIKVKDRYFRVEWKKSFLPYRENEYSGPVKEVKLVKKMVEITKWVAVETK